jgi:RHS repeat-associated protein
MATLKHTQIIKQFHWEILYDERGNLVEYLGNLYYYDGDGNRVWAKDYEGYQASYPGTTLYVGNYYELVSDGRPPAQGTASVCTGAHCIYMPFMYKAPKGISYYYADDQRIAMRSNNTVSWLYGDQLGSVSAVAKADGTLISRSLYYPWGSERLTQGTSPTDYGYTGQMREGDIYFYNARWYNPQLGRFMQADTFVPTAQGTQAWDRFAYVNNNPIIYSDPSGYKLCNDHYASNCYVPIPRNNIPTINSWREIADNPLLLLTYVILSEENGKLFTKSESDAYGVAYVCVSKVRSQGKKRGSSNTIVFEK